MTPVQYRSISIPHANKNRDVLVFLGQICAVEYSDTAGATYVYTPAGIIPTKLSPYDVQILIELKAEQA